MAIVLDPADALLLDTIPFNGKRVHDFTENRRESKRSKRDSISPIDIPKTLVPFLFNPKFKASKQFGPSYLNDLPCRKRTDQLTDIVASMYYVSENIDASTVSQLLRSEHREDLVWETWTLREIAQFEASICELGKDFHAIQKRVLTKTVNEVVQFYYFWKNGSNYHIWRHFRKARLAKERGTVRARLSMAPPPPMLKYAEGDLVKFRHHDIIGKVVALNSERGYRVACLQGLVRGFWGDLDLEILENASEKDVSDLKSLPTPHLGKGRNIERILSTSMDGNRLRLDAESVVFCDCKRGCDVTSKCKCRKLDQSCGEFCHKGLDVMCLNFDDE